MKNRMLRFRAQIKDGAIVGQDFSWAKWENDGTVFHIHFINEEKVKCTAYGYGVIDRLDGKSYGNGSLYAYAKDLIPEKE